MKPQHSSAGFTLLELLVSIVLLVAFAATLFPTVGNALKHWERSRELNASADELRLLELFVRRTLEQQVAVSAGRREDHTVVFDGRRDQLEFVTILPPHFGVRGLYRLRLTSGTGDGLSLAYGLYREAVESIESGPGPREETVADTIARLRFRYFGARQPGGDTIWTDTWRNARALPLAVRVEITTHRGERRIWHCAVPAGGALPDRGT